MKQAAVIVVVFVILVAAAMALPPWAIDDWSKRGQVGAASVPTDGLLAWYRLSSATTTNDTVGTTHGVLLSPSTINSSGLVSGVTSTNGGMAFITPKNLEIRGAQSLMCWVQSFGAQSGGVLVGRGLTRQVSTDPTVIAIALSVGVSTSAVLVGITSSGTNYVYARGDLIANSFPHLQWKHTAVTYAPSNYVRVWMDGTIVVESNIAPIYINNSTNLGSLLIGLNSNMNVGCTPYIAAPSLRPLNGVIDEVMIYNRAIESNEMADIIAATRGAK